MAYKRLPATKASKVGFRTHTTACQNFSLLATAHDCVPLAYCFSVKNRTLANIFPSFISFIPFSRLDKPWATDQHDTTEGSGNRNPARSEGDVLPMLPENTRGVGWGWGWGKWGGAQRSTRLSYKMFTSCFHPTPLSLSPRTYIHMHAHAHMHTRTRTHTNTISYTEPSSFLLRMLLSMRNKSTQGSGTRLTQT